MRTPYVYIRRENSPSGLGIRLDKDGTDAVSIFVTSSCCGASLNRAERNDWDCAGCGKRSKTSGNGSRVPLDDIHLLGERWLKHWVSEWTDIPVKNIDVTIEYP